MKAIFLSKKYNKLFPFRETFYYFCIEVGLIMKRRFSVMLLKSAKEFIFSLDKNVQTKIFFTLDKAAFINDPKLFKKLQDEIWEFRVKYKGLQIRLLSFWDKRDHKNTLVISTHGFVKKTGRVPKGEIDNAIAAMKQYFENH